MSDDTYTVTVPMTIERQVIEDLLDTALAAEWGWWGASHYSEEGDELYVDEIDDDGTVLEHRTVVHFDSVAEAIARIMSGNPAIRPDLAKQVASAVTDNPDIDADAADCILQVAVFGEVKYG